MRAHNLKSVRLQDSFSSDSYQWFFCREGRKKGHRLRENGNNLERFPTIRKVIVIFENQTKSEHEESLREEKIAYDIFLFSLPTCASTRAVLLSLQRERRCRMRSKEELISAAWFDTKQFIRGMSNKVCETHPRQQLPRNAAVVSL